MQKKEIDDLNDTIKWFKTARRNNDMACILPDGPMKLLTDAIESQMEEVK